MTARMNGSNGSYMVTYTSQFHKSGPGYVCKKTQFRIEHGDVEPKGTLRPQQEILLKTPVDSLASPF